MYANVHLPLFVFGGFLGGLLVISRTVAWLLGVRAALRAGQPWLVPLLLHAGPWTLLLAVGLLVYIASQGRADNTRSAFGGVAAAVMLLAWASIRVHRKAPTPLPPLTPELLARKRKAFFLTNIALFSLAAVIVAGWTSWGHPDRDDAMPFFWLAWGPLTGWMWSLFMWQFHGTALEVADKKRRQREEREQAGR